MDLRKYPLDSQVMMKFVIIFIMIWSIKSMTMMMMMMSWFYIWLNANPLDQLKSTFILGLSCECAH